MTKRSRFPTEDAARTALRTQQIIAWETGVANTVDPVGGSYAIEELTDDIERGAEDLIGQIERAGGTLTAIETGFIQRQIQESAYRAQLAIDAGEAVVVGVNEFTDEAEEGRAGVAVFRVDPELERCQIDRVRTLRAGRDAGACVRSLAGVSDAAGSGANLMPPIIAAVEAKATVGEISDAMRSVFGEHVSDA